MILRFLIAALDWCARVCEAVRGEYVSADWIRSQQRSDQRVEFHGTAIRWPLNKIVNEHGLFNSKRLRKRA